MGGNSKAVARKTSKKDDSDNSDDSEDDSDGSEQTDDMEINGGSLGKPTTAAARVGLDLWSCLGANVSHMVTHFTPSEF